MDSPAEAVPKFRKGYFWIMFFLFSGPTVGSGILGVLFFMLSGINSGGHPASGRSLVSGALILGGIIGYWAVFWSLVWLGANHRRAPGWLISMGFLSLVGLVLGALWVSVVGGDGFLWAVAAIPHAAGYTYALIKAN